MDFENVWLRALPIIRSRVGSPVFHCWFTPVVFRSDDGDTLCLEVPSDLYRAWFQHQYSALVRGVLDELGRSHTDVVLSIGSNEGEPLDPVAGRLDRLERKVDRILDHLSRTSRASPARGHSD